MNTLIAAAGKVKTYYPPLQILNIVRIHSQVSTSCVSIHNYLIDAIQSFANEILWVKKVEDGKLTRKTSKITSLKLLYVHIRYQVETCHLNLAFICMYVSQHLL